MHRRTLVPLALAAALLAAGVPALAHGPLDANPWLDRTDLVIAHQGGNHEAPGNTLFGLKESYMNGADAFEVDLHRTLDGHLVAVHDPTVDRTTNGSGAVQHMTLAEVKALDPAHWWLPDQGSGNHSADASAYPYRGVATGDQAPPTGYDASDFRIPTLQEILDWASGTDVMMVLELKAASQWYQPMAHRAVAQMDAHGYGDGSHRVIAGSFNDAVLESFRAQATARGMDVSTSWGLGQAAGFWAASQQAGPGAPHPVHDALQLPPTYQGVPVMSEDRVDDAHANGQAVHVWTINDRAGMEAYLEMGVDGILTDRPCTLLDVLATPC